MMWCVLFVVCVFDCCDACVVRGLLVGWSLFVVCCVLLVFVVVRVLFVGRSF